MRVRDSWKSLRSSSRFSCSGVLGPEPGCCCGACVASSCDSTSLLSHPRAMARVCHRLRVSQASKQEKVAKEESGAGGTGLRNNREGRTHYTAHSAFADAGEVFSENATVGKCSGFICPIDPQEPTPMGFFGSR